MLMDANVMGWLVPGLDDASAEAWQLLTPSACSKKWRGLPPPSR
jgi:hypothetical protein